MAPALPFRETVGCADMQRWHGLRIRRAWPAIHCPEPAANDSRVGVMSLRCRGPVSKDIAALHGSCPSSASDSYSQARLLDQLGVGAGPWGVRRSSIAGSGDPLPCPGRVRRWAVLPTFTYLPTDVGACTSMHPCMYPCSHGSQWLAVRVAQGLFSASQTTRTTRRVRSDGQDESIGNLCTDPEPWGRRRNWML